MYDKNLLDAIAKILTERGESIAVAESVTSGHLQAAFSQASDAMQFFQGGITTYNLGQKTRHLSVDPIRADACNCVSETVSEQMAASVAKSFLSTWAIAVTGFAAKAPELGVTQLYAIYAIVKNGVTVKMERIDAKDGNVPETQLFFTKTILEIFHRLLIADPSRTASSPSD